MGTLFTIALRNVLRNRRRTLITLAALVVGVGVMVTVRGVVNGLQRALVTNVSEGLTGAVQVHKAGYLANVISSPLNLNMPQAVLQQIRQVPQVTAVAGRIAFAGMVSNGDNTLFTAVSAVDPQFELEVCPLRTQTLENGAHFPGVGLEDGVVLTQELARSIGLQAGGEAALLAPDLDGALSGENMHLAGTMHLALPGEKKLAMAPLPLAQRLLKMEGRITEAVVRVDPIEAAEEVATALRSKLGPEYEVHVWSDVAMFVRQAMQRQNFMAALIAAAFMLLMLLGVANTMLMSMMERTREIGTMMAVGVRRGKIRMLFIFEALLIGFFGASLGSALGCAMVAFLHWKTLVIQAPGSGVPFTLVPYMTVQYVALMMGVATLGSGIFALYPAWRASALRPVQALAGQ